MRWKATMEQEKLNRERGTEKNQVVASYIDYNVCV